ncbi:hypothetical protein [Rhizobium tibeticum]|uniref:hypothetical protein n=1 Tax=Rhizobium tibeticum TaxID=501024 RepID=UPI001160436F|nr:hypothetical protein [Rhizobium tibeticum]
MRLPPHLLSNRRFWSVFPDFATNVQVLEENAQMSDASEALPPLLFSAAVQLSTNESQAPCHFDIKAVTALLLPEHG